MNPSNNTQPRPTGDALDAALAAAALGEAPTSDDAEELDAEDRLETDVIGPLGGPDEIERRDSHRAELDPRHRSQP